MIKTKHGSIKIEGEAGEVLADYAYITYEIISALKGVMGESAARALVKDAYKLGMSKSINAKDKSRDSEDKATDELVSLLLNGDKEAVKMLVKTLTEAMKKE